MGLTLGDLIGVLNEFFSRLGLKKLRFKPAFNPYTEPSMEIFRYSSNSTLLLAAAHYHNPACWLYGTRCSKPPVMVCKIAYVTCCSHQQCD